MFLLSHRKSADDFGRKSAEVFFIKDLDTLAVGNGTRNNFKKRSSVLICEVSSEKKVSIKE
jgi:hypothetical protein